MSRRIKTDYPGVYYREANRIGGKGSEKVYYVVYKKNGKTYEEKAGRQFANNMTPAKAAGIRSALIEGKRLTRKQMRAKKFAEREAATGKWTINRLWKAYKESRPDNKALRTDEGRFQKYLKPTFENREPAEIIKLDVDRLRIRLMKKLSSQTVKHILNLLTWIINYGVKNGFCPALSFKIQKPTVNNVKTEDLNIEQMKRLLDVIDKDTHAHAGDMMFMALITGMRRGELFKLKWSDIDFERGFIHIRDPKGGPDQKIPLSESSRQLLKKRPRYKRSQHIFPGRGGKQLTDINKAVNEIKNKSGLPKDFRPLHGLRHVYASMLASSGQVDMYTLQKLLTHKSPAMTQRYAHLRDETLKRASDLADAIINDVLKEKSKSGNTNL